MHNIENDVIYNFHKMCITSKTMLYTSDTKCVCHRKRCYTQGSQNVYNIENDVIHNCHEICITSKTMLYTIARKFDEKTCYTGKNVLKKGCIKCFSISYTLKA